MKMSSPLPASSASATGLTAATIAVILLAANFTTSNAQQEQQQQQQELKVQRIASAYRYHRAG
jgi:hypothetical protein